MSINYAKHEEEFHGVFKLSNGEEILGRAVLTEDNGETLVFIQDPVSVSFITKELEDGAKVMRGMGFHKWMQMSDEEFYVIWEKDILAIASMNKEVTLMYDTFILGSEGMQNKRKQSRTHAKHSGGYLGNIEEARKLFEKIYKT